MKKPKAKRGADWSWQTSDESRPVHVEDIVKDEALQVRMKPVTGLAKKYADEMQCGHKFPPVALADVEGKLYLLDGWHRMDAAALRLGHEAVEATITPMRWLEAVGAASGSNATHGQGLSQADKRKKLDMHIKAGLHKKGGEIVQTYGDLVKLLGIKKTTLYRWMEHDHPVTFRKMQKDTPQKRDAEPPEIDHDPEHLRRAQDALRLALHHCDQLRDPEQRYDLIQEAEQMVQSMKLEEHCEKEW